MSTFYLVRHGTNDWLGKIIPGWMPIELNEEGRQQAARVAARLKSSGISRIYSSPVKRATQTAQPLADAVGIPVEPRDEFGEVHPGEWTGKTMDELEQDPRWRLYNRFRSGTRAPGGELMIETQARVVVGMERLRVEHPNESIAIFSHGDPIKVALMNYLGMPIDFIYRLEVGPASVSVVRVEDWGATVLKINEGA